MGAPGKRSVMVHGHNQSKRLATALHFLNNRLDYTGVKIFNGLFFICGQSLVSGLIRCFNMDEDKILICKGIKSCLGLSFVVGVKIAGCTLNLKNIKAGTFTDTF